MNRESAFEAPKTIADEIRPLWKIAKERVSSVGEFMNKITDFAQGLKKKYPDAPHRRAYHALIGSTMREHESDIIEKDFPGEDSVVRFLRSLANE